jgi:hypothetical protein
MVSLAQRCACASSLAEILLTQQSLLAIQWKAKHMLISCRTRRATFTVFMLPHGVLSPSISHSLLGTGIVFQNTGVVVLYSHQMCLFINRALRPKMILGAVAGSLTRISSQALTESCHVNCTRIPSTWWTLVDSRRVESCCSRQCSRRLMWPG